MGPKKAGSKGSKASSSAAVPVVDHKLLASAQNRYKSACKPGKIASWISSDLKGEAQFIYKLVRIRVVLDKENEIKEELKDKKDGAAQLIHAVYSSLPRGVETASSTADAGGRLSLSMLEARIQLICLLIKEKVVPSFGVIEEELRHVRQLLEKGFKKDSWQKHFFDPRSEEVVEKKKDEIDQPATAVAAELFEKLGAAYDRLCIVSRVNLQIEGKTAEAEAIQALPASQVLLQPSQTELAAAKAPQVKSTEPVNKQPANADSRLKHMETKHVTDHLLRQDNSRDQQRSSKAGRDAERSRDIKRGKQLPEDNRHQQAYAQARQQEEENIKKATEVFEFLQGKVLGEGISPEEHLQMLQSHTTVGLDALKKVAEKLAASKDKELLPLHCKQQLGAADPPTEALSSQLKALSNDKVWQVYLDEAAAQGKSGKQLTWSSWSEFEDHVVSTYLEGEVKDLPLAFSDAPEMAATYSAKGQLTEQLADEAADSIRQGQIDKSNPWVQAFGEECPLSRYLRTLEALPNEDHFTDVVSESTDDEDNLSKQHRLYTALGFALLQLQRKQVVVDPVHLSYKPDWVVLAYHTLNLIPALLLKMSPHSDEFNIYNYWRTKQACQSEFRRVMLPHVFQDAAAANGTNNSEPLPSYTDGLAADNATMLQMLLDDELLAGPLLLAVQLFLHRAIGDSLDLSKAMGRQLNTASVEAVLSALQERQQLELRQFLLTVLYHFSADLAVFKQFWQTQQQERVQPEVVPVMVVNHGKEGPKLTLSREYYEQACLTAALPLAPNSGCCEKHHRRHLQAAAEGGSWSKCDPSVSYDDYHCVDVPVPMDEKAVQLYLLQPARVVQAQKEKQLKIGTKEGLKTLVDKLFAVHSPVVKAVGGEDVEPVDKRTTWDRVRMDLTLAAQLAVHRANLAQLIEQNAHDLETEDLGKGQLQDRMRALLCQRVAGNIWQLRVWLWFFDRQIQEFRSEETSIQEQLRQLADAGEKEKSSKGSSKVDIKEKEEKLLLRQNQVTANITNCEAALANVKNMHSRVMSDAQSYPDLLHTYYSVESGHANALASMFSMLANELLAPASPGTEAARAQLQDALRLARLTLFDMDVWVMTHVLHARRLVLGSIWKNSQMAVLLSLSVEALKNSLEESRSKSAELELLELELLEAKDSKQQQQGKAAGKKKKKKGGAKPTDKSHMQKLIAVADDSEEEEEFAVKAEEPQRDDEAYEQQADEDGADAAWPHTPHVDFSKLGLLAHSDEEEEEQQQWQQTSKKESSSRDGRGRGGSSSSSQATSESVEPGKLVREGADRRPAVRPASGSGNQRTAAPDTKQQQQQKLSSDVHFYGPPVCGQCGDEGHLESDCKTPFCRVCNNFGHPHGRCKEACSQCHKLHPPCTGRFTCPHYKCRVCYLWGHKAEQCPRNRCHRCGRFGHSVKHCKAAAHDTRSYPVGVCALCGQAGHTDGSAECPRSRSSTAAACPPPPPAAAAPDRSSSRPGRGQQGSAAASKEPSAAKQPLQPGNIKLVGGSQARSRDELMNQLFGAVPEYAAGLLAQEDKLDLLCRISAADLASILQQLEAGVFLDEVFNCWRKTSSGSVIPKQLSSAARGVFEQALPLRLREALPNNWGAYTAWGILEQLMTKALKDGGWGHVEKAHFAQARKLAAEANIAADAAPGQQQQQSGSRERLSSTGSAERPSSSGGGGVAAQQPLPPPAAEQLSSSSAATPAKVSFKQAAQTQEQPPLADAIDIQDAAAISKPPPGTVSHFPDYQQQQQQYAQPLVPPSSLYTMPPQPAPGQSFPTPEQLQQQMGALLQMPPAAVGMPPVDVFSGPLAPWMLFHHAGASRAIIELVQSQPVQVELMRVIDQAEPQQLLSKLEEQLKLKLKSMNTGAAEFDPLLCKLAELVSEARRIGRTGMPEPSPMPTPAATVPGLLPHLQQQRGGSGYGVAASVLPPHLQHSHQQQQQQPMWQAPPVVQQQQQPAGGDDGDDSDDDALLGLLTSSGPGAGATQQQQPKTGWNMQSTTGQQHGSGTFNPDFPVLGDEDGMQQAVAASLQSQNNSGSGASRRLAVSAAGLANEAGEYNCFLNVVVQCLWSCRDFRTQVWELPSATVAENAVVLALKRLFVQMQQAEAGWQPGEDRAVVNPTELREALDTATHFRRQEMNDANELLDTLYECFKTAQPPSEHSHRGSRGVLVDSVFGLLVNEQVRCSACGKETHKVASHYEHMLVVNTMGLQFAAMMLEGNGSPDMSQLLRTLFDQEQKMCDKDEGGCGTPCAPERECEAAPKVLTLQLVWDQSVNSEDIEGALKFVQETVDINRLYAAGCMATETTYKLSSAVAYYGQHYMAFVFNPKLEAWLLFDDASVSQVGDWQAVIKKCVNGKIQPSVLFYQTVDIASVGVAAPAATMRMHRAAPPAAPVPAMLPHMQPVPAAAGGHSGSYGALPPHMQHGYHGAMGVPPQQPPMSAAAAAGPRGGPPMGWPDRAPPQHMQQQQQQQQPVPAAAASRPEPNAGWEGPPPSAYAGGWSAPQPAQGAQDAWGAQPDMTAPPEAAAAAEQQPPARPPGPAWGGAGLATSRIANQALKQVIGPAAAPGRGRGPGGPRTAAAPAPGGGRVQGPDASRGRGRS